MKISNNQKNNNQKGFVLLFSVVISSIVFAIALSIAGISLKEIRFSTSGKNTNDAFFAADTGAECALYYDRLDPTDNAFTGTATMKCSGDTILINGSSPIWNFVISEMGSASKGCAQVTMDKTLLLTLITSKGYNNGGSVAGTCIPGSNSLERKIQLYY